MQVNFESGRNQLLAVTLPRLRRLIRIQQRTFPQMKGKSDNAESLVLEKLSRALEADLRPKTALHFWNLSAKITRQVLIDLTRAPSIGSRLGVCSISEEFSALEPASETNNPAKLAELTELHSLIAGVGERLSGMDKELLNLRFYTELSFPGNQLRQLRQVSSYRRTCRTGLGILRSSDQKARADFSAQSRSARLPKYAAKCLFAPRDRFRAAREFCRRSPQLGISDPYGTCSPTPNPQGPSNARQE